MSCSAFVGKKDGNMQAKEDNPKAVGFVYLPAKIPEIMITLM